MERAGEFWTKARCNNGLLVTSNGHCARTCGRALFRRSKAPLGFFETASVPTMVKACPGSVQT